MTVLVVVALLALALGLIYARDQLRHPDYWGRGDEPERGPGPIIIEIGGSTVHHHHETTVHHHHHLSAPEVLTGEVIEPPPPRRHLPPPNRSRLP